MPWQYLQIVLTTAGTGILLFLFLKPIKAGMAGVK
jgi:hypothetical protein